MFSNANDPASAIGENGITAMNDQGTSNHTPLIEQKCGVLVLMLHNRVLWVGFQRDSHPIACSIGE